jgi:hypothetical protein
MRLGSQRREALGVLTMLRSTRTDPVGSRHKGQLIVRQWYGYEASLQIYLKIIIGEWVARGFQNNIKLESIATMTDAPNWLGDELFHRAQKEVLVKKAWLAFHAGTPLPEQYDYRLRWPDITTEDAEAAEYVWPVSPYYMEVIRANIDHPDIRNKRWAVTALKRIYNG